MNPTVHPQTPPHERERWQRAAWLPIPLLVLAMAGVWIADVRVVWTLPVLYWLVHYGSVALGVGFIIIPAARIFLTTGQPSVLMLGCGVLMLDMGVAAMPAGLARSSSIGFAIYNTSILLSALCQFAGVAITTRQKIRLRGSAMWLVATYAGSFVTMGLVIVGGLKGWLPPFFIDAEGGTLLRSGVVGVAVALFLLTAWLLWQTDRREPTPFSYWYALGLLLVSTGLVGSLAIAVANSPLQWIARITQFFGGIYMCVAVLATMRQSHAKGNPLAAVEETWREHDLLVEFRQQTLQGSVLRYGLAVAAVGAAFGLRLAATAWVGPGLPTYVTFYPAVMVAALLAGFGPGVLATALTNLIAGYWLLAPVGQWSVESPANRLGLVIFTAMGLFMSVVADLYRRRRAKAEAYDREASLRQSQARLAAFAAATFEGIAESEAGRVVDCNEQLARMLGYTVDELRGMEIASFIFPEDLDRVMAGIQQGRESAIEHAMRRKDGTRIIVETHGQPVSPGSTRRLSAIRDITQRKLAEEALSESDARFRLALTDSPVSVAIQDLNLVYQWAYNQRTRRPEEIVGRTDGDLFAPEDLPGILEVKRRVLESGTPAHVQSWLTSSGQRVFLDLHYEPLRDSTGAISGIGIAAVNLTDQKWAEEALHESETQYRSLFQHMLSGFAYCQMLYDGDGRPEDFIYLGVNEAFTRLTKLTDVIGKRVTQVIPQIKDLNPELFEIYGGVALTGIPETFEIDFRPLSRRLSVSVYSPTKGYFVAIFDDITERNRAEKALRENEALLRAVTDNSPDAIYAKDVQGRLLMANPATVRSIGKPIEQIVGHTDVEFYDDPAISAAILEHDRLVISGGQAQVFEETVGTPAGQRTMLSSKVPWRNAEGQIIGIVGVSRDITESNLAQEALRESEQRLRMAQQVACIGSFEWNIQSGVNTWTAEMEAMYGLKPGEFGKTQNSWEQLVHPEDRAAAIALNDQTFETGQPVEGEWRVIWPDGSTHWIFGRFQAIKDASGQPLRMRGVNIDITERRKREEEFRRLNRTLQALGHSSQALTRAKEEVTYLQDVCKIVVEDCGHALVWIGYAEDDADRSVRPVSWSGFEEGYLETLKITWADTERGRGPTGTAIRTGKPAFCRNMLTDELFAPWRQEALNRGYASSLALPLRMSGREQPFGALTMYFPDADPFTEDEVRLLTELADDLAQGISTIRLRAERKRAEGVLQATLRRFYAILSKMYAAVLLVTDEGRVEFANQSVCDSFGLEDAPADLEGLTSSEMMEKIKNSYLRPAEAAARIREIVDRGQPVKGEELLMQGGRTSLRDFVPLNVDGKSYGRLWIHSDITEHKRAEEALRESEKRYRNLFNTMVEGFCIVEMIFDAEGKPADYRFLEVNAAFENQTGLHEARGKRMRDLAPAHEAHWFETYGKIALTGEPAHFVNEAKALNRWFEVYAYRVGEPEERHVAIIFNDISEQKRIEAALRTSEKRYRNLFSTMAEGFCIIEMIFDAEGRPADYRFLEVNAAFEKQTGLHDVQGKRIRDLVPSNEAYWFELYGKIALTGEPAHFVNETQGLNRWFEVHAYRVGEPEERHVAIVFNDISEQKRIEQTLRESERQFRELAEGIPQLAWMANPDGWIYWYNQRWYDYTGTTIEKMEGWGWQSVHDPNELPNVMERWQASIATGAPFEMTFPLRGADGVFRPFLTRGFPLRDAAGRVMRWFGTNTDVNDLKQAEEALRVSKEALFESHMELEQRIAERTQELTLSLAAVQSEMIVRKQTEEQLRDLSARLLRAQDEERSRIARDLHDSTGQLLVALKMSLTQLEHLVARVPKADELCNDVASLADQALQEVRTMSHLLHPPLLDELGFSSAAESYIQGFTKRSGIKTTLNLSAATKLTKTAELTLFRVLQESLTNVLRHSGSSSVEVRLDTEGEDCVLMIRDFGKGLSREALTTFNQTGAGVGVGLGGMKQRMRDLGGQLRVESDERGTTVVASLPKKLASATMVVTPDSSHKRKSTN